MKSAPAVTIELDKALIVGALLLLFGMGWLTGAPIFEPFGRGRLTYLTLLGLPVLLAILLLRRAEGTLSSLVRAWWPVIGALSVYESLKHMHANRITEWLGIRPKDELMLAIDERLFGKALPLYMDSWTVPWFQNLMSWFYVWVYYLGPFLLLAAVYLMGRHELFRRLRLGLVLGLLGGYVLYILVPVAGPLFLIGDQFQHPIPNHSRVETLVFDTLRFNWDCFPSLHTAIPWILTLLIWRRLSRLDRRARRAARVRRHSLDGRLAISLRHRSARRVRLGRSRPAGRPRARPTRLRKTPALAADIAPSWRSTSLAGAANPGCPGMGARARRRRDRRLLGRAGELERCLVDRARALERRSRGRIAARRGDRPRRCVPSATRGWRPAPARLDRHPRPRRMARSPGLQVLCDLGLERA